jgi:NADPH:quinone reductase-like Zn-dependent oxidoreductase
MPYLTPLSVQPSRAIHTHNYKTDPDWDKKVLEITDGAGAEHILEVGGPGTIEKSFGAIKRGRSITT